MQKIAVINTLFNTFCTHVADKMWWTKMITSCFSCKLCYVISVEIEISASSRNEYFKTSNINQSRRGQNASGLNSLGQKGLRQVFLSARRF